MGQGDTSTSMLLDGRYHLGERVGSGGMATVYRAEDTHLERTVAIKMLRDDDDAVVDVADRAHTEKALLASVSHPSLVTLFDARLEPGGSRYLVMEFVDGPTLSAQLSAGPLPPSQVARLACDLAEALATVHSAGIVHRDVKPSNVLLGPAGGGRRVAKLADFGIACSVDSPRSTSPGMVLGTLAYMAPEQVRGEDPTPAVDVFSLGLVLLEALSGQSGYPVSAAVASAVARLTMHPEIPDVIDDEWRRLIEWMTRLDPAERASAQDVADAARRLLPAPDRAPRGIAVPAPVAAAAPGTVERSRPVTAPTVVAPAASAAVSAADAGPVAPIAVDAHRATTAQSPLPLREGHRAARRVRARRGRRLLISVAAALVLGIGIAGGATMLSGGDDTAVDAVSGAIVGVTMTTAPAPTTETPETPITEEVVTEEVVTEEQSPVDPAITPAEQQTNDDPGDRSEEASQNEGPPSFSNGNKGDDSSKKDESSKGKKN